MPSSPWWLRSGLRVIEGRDEPTDWSLSGVCVLYTRRDAHYWRFSRSAAHMEARADWQTFPGAWPAAPYRLFEVYLAGCRRKGNLLRYTAGGHRRTYAGGCFYGRGAACRDGRGGRDAMFLSVIITSSLVSPRLQIALQKPSSVREEREE